MLHSPADVRDAWPCDECAWTRDPSERAVLSPCPTCCAKDPDAELVALGWASADRAGYERLQPRGGEPPDGRVDALEVEAPLGGDREVYAPAWLASLANVSEPHFATGRLDLARPILLRTMRGLAVEMPRDEATATLLARNLEIVRDLASADEALSILRPLLTDKDLGPLLALASPRES